MIVLCACSGMNPRGEVARVGVYDLSVENEDIEYCCVVASGGNYKNSLTLLKTILLLQSMDVKIAVPKQY